MQVHTPGAHLGEELDDGQRIEHGANDITKWIASTIADRPESERKLVLGPGRIGLFRHVISPGWRRMSVLRGEYISERRIDPSEPRVLRSERRHTGRIGFHTVGDTDGFMARTLHRRPHSEANTGQEGRTV